MTYADAIAQYGSDKPDLRVGMVIRTSRRSSRTPASASSGTRWRPAASCAASSCPTAAGRRARSSTTLANEAKALGAGGLVWVRQSGDAVQSPALKAAGEAALRAALDAAGAGASDLLLLACGPADATSKVLGQLRLSIARAKGWLAADKFAFTWVTDFPLLEWDAEEGRWVAMHHPFTSPIEAHMDRMEQDPGARARPGVRSRAERERDRRRQHPHPRHRPPAAHVLAPRDHATSRQSCASGSSWNRSSTARRPTAASPSASTGSWRFSPASRRSATSSRSRKPRRLST